MTNDDFQRSGDPRADRSGMPNEVEAVDEFETAPQVVSDAEPAIDPSGQQGYGAPPSAVESFDRAAAPIAPGTPTAPAAPEAPAAPAAAAQAAPEQPITRCPRCGTENQPGIAFCRNCGQRLVAAGAATVQRPGAPEGMQTCTRCGTVNRTGIAFCQNCGAGLRAASPSGPPSAAQESYVPPVVAGPPEAQPVTRTSSSRAVLGPIVLLIGAIGLAVAWALPFEYGDRSLFAAAFGADGYGYAFWNAYPDVGGSLADQAYFGFAAPVPILVGLLVLLSIGGLVRGRPGLLQVLGLVIAFLWAAGLAGLFIAVEVLITDAGPFTALLRALSPAGIFFFLSSIVVVIGTLTRFARS